MFVRTKKHPYSDKSTVLICHSHRYGSAVVQHVICKIGTSNKQYEIVEMEKIAGEELNKLKQANYKPPKDESRLMPNLSAIKEISRGNSGIKDILGTLYDSLGFNNILDSKNKDILKAVVLARFLEPSSKAKASSILEKRFQVDVSVDRIYRMMDELQEHAESAKKAVFNSTADVTKEIDLMFFDVTTLHFESIDEDTLRKFGFSKNFRFNTTQVVLALATTCEGLPIGFKLFPGNTAEVSTLIACINEWRKFIPIKDTMIVGDRAMMSKDNLQQLDTNNIKYIVAYPMKKASLPLQEEILSDVGYGFRIIENEFAWKKELEIGANRRLIVTYNKKRHKHDQKERDKLIKRIKAKLGKKKSAKKLISNQGYIKYTTINGEAIAELDEEKIAKESRWDGLHGVLTNSNLSVEEIVFRYRNLWVIEESFRINKHSLKMRPIYHFNPRRVLAHILICFLTFALARQAQYKLKKNDCDVSIDEIRDELMEVQHSILKDRVTGELYKMPSHMTYNVQKLYKIFGKEKNLDIQRYDLSNEKNKPKDLWSIRYSKDIEEEYSDIE